MWRPFSHNVRSWPGRILCVACKMDWIPLFSLSLCKWEIILPGRIIYFLLFFNIVSRVVRIFIWASHKCDAKPCANITSVPLGNCCKHFFAFIRQEQASKSIATSLHFFIPSACLCILRLFAACVAPKKQMLAF